ncbi:MAG: GDYXXLXY domain-containing protein [Candidatus Thiodiazotropha sp. (ex Monitilora ramsayi)]|nr:GDYXXLXY domain-containing protein [Candidatus Thiodiazotropha sp. (ex Monitilora ramsayi)]
MHNSFIHLSDRFRLIVLVLTTLVILIVGNSQIAIKQAIIDEGNTLLLRLAPKDPRSLLQGDYMALRYAMADQVAAAAMQATITDGLIIVSLDTTGEASFVGLNEDQPLAESQQLLRFRKRGDSVRLASDAFFFEEGEWKTYSDARYGELRVNKNGDAVLIGLYDREKRRLGKALH